MNEHNPKIYLLPNLMTAGNLFCGFAATLKIVQGALIPMKRLRFFTPPSGSFSARASSMSSMADWLGSGGRTARLAANSIRWPTLSPLVSRLR
jgi:phosphatidylserine synthase